MLTRDKSRRKALRGSRSTDFTFSVPVQTSLRTVKPLGRAQEGAVILARGTEVEGITPEKVFFGNCVQNGWRFGLVVTR